MTTDTALPYEELQHQLMQTQQMLLTVIYAQPGHKITLTEADFESLPDTPQTWQDNHKDGSFTLTVSSIRPAAQ